MNAFCEHASVCLKNKIICNVSDEANSNASSVNIALLSKVITISI